MEVVLDLLNLAFPAIHLIIFVVGLSNTSLLLIAAFLKTPPALKSYSIMIKIGTVNDLISVLCDSFAMQRMILVPGNMMYLSEGPCALISARVCYLTYCMQMLTQLYTIFVITASFAFRLWVLHHSAPKTLNVLLGMAALYAAPAVVVFSLTFAQADDAFIREFLVTKAPYYLSEPGVLTGHYGFTLHIMFIVAFCAVTPGISYVVIMICRRKILAKLSNAGMSTRTRKMHDSLVKALTVHAILPSIAVIAVAIFFVLFFDIYRHPALEKGTFTVSTIPSCLASFCTLYYVEPYRRFIVSLFKRLPFLNRRVSTTSAPEAVSSKKRSSANVPSSK